jgi:pimeloyl-ACP methyl ester carboxylesterase
VPAVFVHGVPDTPRVWSSTVDALTREDVVTLRLPGFGRPCPPGFGATKEDYASWLVAALGEIDGPIDLVGHDWGGLLVIRALTLAPDCARSWAVGGAPLHPDYRWHRLARRWQTPLIGELLQLAFTTERIRRALMDARLCAEDAAAVAAEVDPAMKDAILKLYRSARRVGREWTPAAGQMRTPGLLLWGAHDPYVAPRFGRALAERTGADFECYEDCGHWWQREQPGRVAARLEAHWKTLAA